MSTNTPTDPFQFRLDGVRLSYLNCFVAQAMEGGKPKFSAVLLLDKKKHAADIAKIEKLTERAALEKFGKKVTLKHVPLRDGNEKDGKEGYGDEVMFITAKSDNRPAVVDEKRNPVTAEDGKVYSGCYANVLIQLFAYKHPTGGNGVAVGLKAIQFAKHGPAFGAGPVDASKVFDEVPAGESAEDY